MCFFKNADDGVYWTLVTAVAAASICFLVNAVITSDTEEIKMAKLGYEEKIEINYSPDNKYPTVIKHWVKSGNCTGDSTNE